MRPTGSSKSQSQLIDAIRNLFSKLHPVILQEEMRYSNAQQPSVGSANP